MIVFDVLFCRISIKLCWRLSEIQLDYLLLARSRKKAGKFSGLWPYELFCRKIWEFVWRLMSEIYSLGVWMKLVIGWMIVVSDLNKTYR